MSNEYAELLEKSRKFINDWKGKINNENLDSFIQEVVKLDYFRFSSSFEVNIQ